MTALFIQVSLERLQCSFVTVSTFLLFSLCLVMMFLFVSCHGISSVLFLRLPCSSRYFKMIRGKIENVLRLKFMAANRIGIKIRRTEVKGASKAALFELAPRKNTISKSSLTELEAWDLSNVYRVGSVL